jgi:hypothetical protein
LANAIERRRYNRLEVNWPIIMAFDQDELEGETINITVDGVLIRCEEPLQLNEIFRISIKPPNRQVIEVTGKVIWSDHYAIGEQNTAFGMGICFVKISEVDRHFLKDLVSAHYKG